MGAGLRIAVAWSRREGEAAEVRIELPLGSTVADALRAVATGYDVAAEATEPAQPVGVWGRLCPPTTLLRDGDRVEVYRPLAMSAVEARRRRARQRRMPDGS